MSYIYTNPNPTKKLIGDCVVRAIAIVTNSRWEEAYMNLCLKGLSMCDMPNANAVWISFMRDLGYKKKHIPNSCPDCYTIEDFAGEHFKGNYLVSTGNHVVAIVDGNILDAENSSNEIPIMYMFKEVEDE